MNDHEKVRAQVALAAAAALSQDESVQVQRHLTECETCRREFEIFGAYAGGLRQLPQPTIPADLVARTQARVLVARAGVTNHRGDAAMLVGMAVLSWVMTLSTWVAIRILTGGSLNVLGTNLLSPAPWFLTSFAVTAATAGVAALMLSSRREARRTL
jgi:predicted anti-sigma-YlaC factor YlaD